MILLVSGGIDSYITWNYLYRPTPLFVDYGQPYLDIELEAVTKLYPSFEKIKIEGIKELNPDKIFVPARNLMLASLALRYSNSIALGGVKDEKCKDKSPYAFKMMSSILSEFNNDNVTVFSPLWHLTKAQAVGEYLQTNSADPLHDTISCYSQRLCNDCESCFRRFVALAHNNIIEPDRLPNANIIIWFLKRINTQPYNRGFEILTALLKAKIGIAIAKDAVRYLGIDYKITSEHLKSQLPELDTCTS